MKKLLLEGIKSFEKAIYIYKGSICFAKSGLESVCSPPHIKN